MPGYFKPLRRKIGSLILLLACLFAAEWIRSRWVVDQLFFRTDNQTLCVTFSSLDGIGLTVFHKLDRKEPRLNAGIQSLSLEFEFVGGPSNGVYKDRWNEGVWNELGFRTTDYFLENTTPPKELTRVRKWIVPHWSIAIPLTLLAAYLLLSKPRAMASGKPVKTL